MGGKFMYAHTVRTDADAHTCAYAGVSSTSSVIASVSQLAHIKTQPGCVC